MLEIEKRSGEVIRLAKKLRLYKKDGCCNLLNINNKLVFIDFKNGWKERLESTIRTWFWRYINNEVDEADEDFVIYKQKFWNGEDKRIDIKAHVIYESRTGLSYTIDLYIFVKEFNRPGNGDTERFFEFCRKIKTQEGTYTSKFPKYAFWHKGILVKVVPEKSVALPLVLLRDKKDPIIIWEFNAPYYLEELDVHIEEDMYVLG